MRSLSTFKCGQPRTILAAAMAGVTLGILVAMIGASTASANGVPFVKGDVLAGTGNAQVKNFSSSGTLQDTLTDNSGAAFTTGMCFDSAHNLYVTDFTQTMSKYDEGGNLVTSPFGEGFTEGQPESCTVDAADHIFVGGPISATIEELDTSGKLLNTFSVESAGRTGGTDWVDLAANQCSLYYTGEGSVIKRFNVCTNTQEADFATGLPEPCFALRIRPKTEEVIVACESEAVRLDSSGKVLQTYPVSSSLFALNLDPDGTSFWTGDFNSGEIFHIDIATGAVIHQFNSSPATNLAGLAIIGEIQVASPEITLAPPTAENPVGTTHTVTATVTEHGEPQSGVTVTFTVTGANPQTGKSTTNAAGEATFTYKGENAGEDTIVASFVDNQGKTDESNSVTKIWTGDQPISATGQNLSGTEGAEASGTVATFTDPDTSATASEYSATIEWGDGTSSAGTVSGSKGSFSVSGSHTYADEGSYPIKVVITDVDNESNTATTSSSANIADAALSASGVSTTSPMAFSGTVASLTDENTAGSAADFTATIEWGDGTSSAGTVSGSAGSYSISGSHTYASTGSFEVTVKIVDDGGSTAEAKSRILIFATTTGGNFVIGDGNSTVGDSVTFWGAQWWKLNSLSGGSAPAAFKGFANTPSTPPACGSSWSTNPGNSSGPPPGPLPEYMAVIVSSHVTQSGSQISGDTSEVVVVKTNPGYAPNPGHGGSGTVVAVVCHS